MSNPWTKETALLELKELTECTFYLSKRYPFCAEHTRWMARTLTFLEEIFGLKSRYYITFHACRWQFKGSFPISYADDIDEVVRQRNQQAYLRDLEIARGLLMAAADHLNRAGLERVYSGADTGPESNTIMKLINLAEHSLRKVIRTKPATEREVQDAFDSLLVGADISFKRETENIEYSSKTYTPDFTVPKINLAIELKLCGREGREKEIIAEVNDDILAYGTRFANLLFVVYDLGFVRDIERFTSSFEKNQNVVVVVVKH